MTGNPMNKLPMLPSQYESMVRSLEATLHHLRANPVLPGCANCVFADGLYCSAVRANRPAEFEGHGCSHWQEAIPF